MKFIKFILIFLPLTTLISFGYGLYWTEVSYLKWVGLVLGPMVNGFTLGVLLGKIG